MKKKRRWFQKRHTPAPPALPVALDPEQARTVIALAAQRQQIIAMANREIGEINAALQSLIARYAGELGLPQGRYDFDLQEGQILLVERPENSSP